MGYDISYDYILINFNKFSQLLFLIGFFVLAIRTKKISIVCGLFGISVFVVSNFLGIRLERHYFQLVQAGTIQAPLSESLQWNLARIGAQLGFFIGGISLLWFGITCRFFTNAAPSNIQISKNNDTGTEKK